MILSWWPRHEIVSVTLHYISDLMGVPSTYLSFIGICSSMEDPVFTFQFPDIEVRLENINRIFTWDWRLIEYQSRDWIQTVGLPSCTTPWRLISYMCVRFGWFLFDDFGSFKLRWGDPRQGQFMWHGCELGHFYDELNFCMFLLKFLSGSRESLVIVADLLDMDVVLAVHVRLRDAVTSRQSNERRYVLIVVMAVNLDL